ncbi:uncharacterized protein PHACADRAFT_210810 [Phanerochaete carnosa HHB-10118-sp]|uniref:Uncharacterized protein n=1 Tax=Phanerochaete carnosa (strain HHB-10118-sp) TaxID=650164 RepID=K5W1T6_PHACS|nr:uncharacterized protein PHACADRAFT_210810 [Phanerochaete carnosa HHB-10118-sp]EKM53090.1 hypothetical protein PHACADRAFT_210810 [Phanerochaete carnosa HHB-10118-sp]
MSGLSTNMAAGMPRSASSMLLLSTELCSLDSTLGAIVIAEILVAVLYGITSMQVYIYFHCSPRDSRLVKRTIFFLWILSSIYLVFASHAVYYYAVTNFMNPLAATKYSWSLVANLFVGDLIEIIVTLTFAYRIYILSGRKWPLILIILPQVASCIGTIATGVVE